MTNLPQVSEPLAYALRWLEDNKNNEFLLAMGKLLHPKGGERVVREHFKLRAMSGALGMKSVIDEARGRYHEAHEALCELNYELKHHHRDVPPALDVYCAEALLKPRPKGRRKTTNAVQDALFVGLIDELVRQFGLDPTRKTNAIHCNSACDVLAVAVNRTPWLNRRINYKGAEAIFLKWKQAL
jgi:hypothetical protein